MAINVVVFLMQLADSGPRTMGLLAYAMIPRELVTGQQVPPHPAVDPAWITIFTSMFMHGGLLHIGSNMLYLIVFGNNIEDRLGHFRYLLFYLASGIAAALAHIASDPASTIPTLGASGAVAGVLGAYLVAYPHARIVNLVFLFYILTTVELPAIVVLGFWIVTQLLSANIGGGSQVGGGVAYWAHIGGFAAGIVLLFLLGGMAQSKRRRYRYD